MSNRHRPVRIRVPNRAEYLPDPEPTLHSVRVPVTVTPGALVGSIRAYSILSARTPSKVIEVAFDAIVRELLDHSIHDEADWTLYPPGGSAETFTVQIHRSLRDRIISASTTMRVGSARTAKAIMQNGPEPSAFRGYLYQGLRLLQEKPHLDPNHERIARLRTSLGLTSPATHNVEDPTATTGETT